MFNYKVISVLSDDTFHISIIKAFNVKNAIKTWNKKPIGCISQVVKV